MSKKFFIIYGAAIILCAVSVGVWFYAQPDAGYTVYVYLFNPNANQLEQERRIVPYAEQEEMVQTVVLKLYDTPNSINLRQTIPADLIIEEVLIAGSTMKISFPKQYNDMAPYEEAIFRASLVRTMTGLPFIDIEGVLILVDGEEFMGPFGEPLGVQTQEMVLINPDIMPRRVFTQTLTLYFVSEDIDGLLPEERTVERPDGIPIEQAVVEELINGPLLEGRIATIPVDTRIRDVQTNAGVCFINLSDEFVSNFSGHQTLAELTLQSIVHSIMENMGNVTSVQFFIESERRDNFNGVPYFDTLFERDKTW